MKVRGIRGAITAEANTVEAITDATMTLMSSIVRDNDIDVDDVASVLLTMTPDLNAAFPAKAVRSMEGWQWVPLICAPEIDVQQALPMCIRVLIHVNTETSQQALIHVYLRGAHVLRPDIANIANGGR
jgi:chorismate mutase